VPTTALLASSDVNGDGIPDLAPDDCNLNGIPDFLEPDTNGNCIPDDCEEGAGYWRFEEASGATATDSTGNGLDGTLNALPFRISDVPVDTVPGTGQTNQTSLYLGWASTTAGGLVRVPDTGGLLSAGSSSFTLEAWVRLDHVSNTGGPDQRQWLCQKKLLGTQDPFLDYGLLVQSGDLGSNGRELSFRWGDGSTSTGVRSSLQIEDTEWHFVSVAYDAASGQLRFGLDGEFDSQSISRSGLTNTGDLLIGGHENGLGIPNHFLRGTVDEFRMSRVFLSPDLLLDSE